MADGDVRLTNESEFKRILRLVQSRSIIQQSLDSERPRCLGGEAPNEIFNFCDEVYYEGPKTTFAYASYPPERSSIGNFPNENKVKALFAITIPILIYLSTDSRTKVGGYSLGATSKYGSLNPSLVLRSLSRKAQNSGEFSKNAYVSFWFSLHPNIRRQILDIIAVSAPLLGVNSSCLQSGGNNQSRGCGTPKSRALIRAVSALRQLNARATVDDFLKTLQIDTNTSAPISLLKRKNVIEFLK